MENPFPSTIITDWSFLDSTQGRNACPLCGKSRKYYCYTCYKVLPHLSDMVPKVKLPVKVNIIKSPKELDGKSTSAHAAVLAPDDVTVFTYPCIPEYDPKHTVVVFPGADSVVLNSLKENWSKKKDPTSLDTQATNISTSLYQNQANLTTHESLQHSTVNSSQVVSSEIDRNNLKEPDDSCTNHQTYINPTAENVDTDTDARSKRKRLIQHSGESTDQFPSKQAKVDNVNPIQTVVFIDSTWNQTQSIISDERIKDLKKVELKSENSNFWRKQEGIPKTYLSTIEALYYFMKEYHLVFVEQPCKNEYDDLLFFFCFMYNKIKTAQNNGIGKKKSVKNIERNGKPYSL